MNVAVLGAGAWGTAMAVHLSARHAVALWMRSDAQRMELERTHANARYLPGVTLPAAISPTTDLADAVRSAGLILVAVPTAGLRLTLAALKPVRGTVPVIWLCKGFEPSRAQLPHQVCAAELGEGQLCGVLSGPSFAEEVARGLPAALTLAATNAEFATTAARVVHGGALRVYSSGDVIGVEVAGAAKNVVAIATGVCDGLKLGHNARAALITRGLAEITRLGVRLGGRRETFMGLAGVGDLILTCTGDLSRNRRVGLRLASGEALAGVLQALGHVAEGVNTAREIARLAGELRIDMPITQAVCRVLEDPAAAAAVVQELLQREPKAES